MDSQPKKGFVNSPYFSGEFDHRHDDVHPVPYSIIIPAGGTPATPERDLRGSRNRGTDEGSGGERGPSPSAAAAASKYEMICPTPACFPASLSQLNIVKYEPLKPAMSKLESTLC